VAHFSRPLLLVVLSVALAAGCNGTVSVGGVVSPSQAQFGTASVAGNWAMTLPSSIGLEIFQNGTALTVLFNGSPCGGVMSPITLQGTVTGTGVALSGSGISIIAVVSLGGAGQTLSGTLTCGVLVISFTATNIANVTGQWNGTFTATGANAGAETAVGANLIETLNPGNFPSLTGTVSFTKLGATESCLAAAGGGPISRGAILGTGVFIQATSTVNGQTLTINGSVDPTGHLISVSSYSVGCGTGAFAGTESGTGSLSRQ
jgi:hypothetical protein